ncbi:ELL-associated factor 2-like isoform X2 [Glandiceps talaboti]
MAERNSAASSSILSSNQVHELKLGSSFDKNAYSSFHTIRYDFKPASMDLTKEASLEVMKGNEISVTVPHIEGTNFTMFKGPQKKAQKECVLIIDNKTGEITLERLSTTIQLKKQRLQGSSKTTSSRPLTPVEHHSKQSKSSSSPPGGQLIKRKEMPPATLAQDIERDLSPVSQPTFQTSYSPAPPSVQTTTQHLPPPPVMTAPMKTQPSPVEDDLIMSSSDSSSSDDSSSDDGSSDQSSSDDEQDVASGFVGGSNHDTYGIMQSSNHGQQNQQRHHHQQTHRMPSAGRPYMSQLREDLHLSESGSDSEED